VAVLHCWDIKFCTLEWRPTSEYPEINHPGACSMIKLPAEAFHSKGHVAWPYILRAQDSNSPELGRFECGQAQRPSAP
jgi:hypothetical protein